MKCHVLALEETKKTLAECFQEERHFCLIFIPFFDQNQHPGPRRLV